MADERNKFMASTLAAAADETGDPSVATSPRPLVAVLERVGQMTHVWPPVLALTRSLMTTCTSRPAPRRPA